MRRECRMLSETWASITVFLLAFFVVGHMGYGRMLEERGTLPHPALQAHNKYRTLHHAPPLNWSEGLAAEAQAIAQGLSAQSALTGKKDAAVNLGQNLAKLAGSMTCEDAGEVASNLWYSQAKNYSYSDPRLDPNTDTFTQVVWKDTKEIGLGCARTADNASGPMYVVALYKPAGNIPKLLRQNVFVPGPRGNDPDVYSTLFRRQFDKAKSSGRIQRKRFVT